MGRQMNRSATLALANDIIPFHDFLENIPAQPLPNTFPANEK
jgi:hypothetical protein